MNIDEIAKNLLTLTSEERERHISQLKALGSAWYFIVAALEKLKENGHAN